MAAGQDTRWLRWKKGTCARIKVKLSLDLSTNQVTSATLHVEVPRNVNPNPRRQHRIGSTDVHPTVVRNQLHIRFVSSARKESKAATDERMHGP